MSLFISFLFFVFPQKWEFLKKNSDESIRKIELEAPDLLDRYDITFINKDIEKLLMEGGVLSGKIYDNNKDTTQEQL